MKAHKFLAVHGVEPARGILANAPDKTATHWEFRKVPNYYSVDFQTWYYDGEWHDSDCHTEQDLIDSYGDDFVVNLSELKQVVASIDTIIIYGGIEIAKTVSKMRNFRLQASEEAQARLDKALEDYEIIESYKQVKVEVSFGIAIRSDQAIGAITKVVDK